MTGWMGGWMGVWVCGGESNWGWVGRMAAAGGARGWVRGGESGHVGVGASGWHEARVSACAVAADLTFL